MPLVICNTRAMSMRLMNDILHPYLETFVTMYLNDLYVYHHRFILAPNLRGFERDPIPQGENLPYIFISKTLLLE